MYRGTVSAAKAPPLTASAAKIQAVGAACALCRPARSEDKRLHVMMMSFLAGVSFANTIPDATGATPRASRRDAARDRRCVRQPYPHSTYNPRAIRASMM
jgi:hypothetical protein